MKQKLLSLVPVLAMLWVPVHAKDADSAEVTARNFYQALLELAPSGLPTEVQMRTLAPLLSSEIIERISVARREQQSFMKENPGEKPPWIEGNLFGSNFEGISSFKLGAASLHEDKASIPVYLEFREGSQVSRWIDVVILQRSGSVWRVWDIHMNAPWSFKTGPSLRVVLSE